MRTEKYIQIKNELQIYFEGQEEAKLTKEYSPRRVLNW